MATASIIAVRPEQGPPISVPFSFFLTGPLAVAIAGVAVLFRSDDGIATIWSPSNVGVLHLGVVGVLLFTMVGALYQMLPVVAGAVVPFVRLAHVVHALMVIGVAALVVGQSQGTQVAFTTAIVTLTAALTLFIVPAGYALARSPVTGPTAWGMKIALISLVVVAFAGLRLASVRSGAGFEGSYLTLRWAHAHLGFLCWVGGLITAVSWQVLPMFFLVAAPPRAVSWGVLGGVVLSLVGLTTAFIVDLAPTLVGAMSLPGAVAVWLVQPVWALTALARRRRKRTDATSWFWYLGLALGIGAFVLGVVSLVAEHPSWPVLYGFVVVWGWAGVVVHGMLTRIVPFLVWLHWCSPYVGKVKTPSAKELLTNRDVSVGFGAHVLSLLAGAIAIGTGSMTAWRYFGASLVIVAAVLVWEIVTTLRRGRVPRLAGLA